MARSGQTWKTYLQLMRGVTGHCGVVHEAQPETAEQDEVFMARFMSDLRAGAVQFQDVMAATSISEKHFRHHLRYIARWGVVRRRLLANGANFQLLEQLRAAEQAHQLDGLTLSGKLVEQRQQLAEHLRKKSPPPQIKALGWLAPHPQSGHAARVYTAREIVWLYDTNEVDAAEGLHPAVARSVIARYLTAKGGVVADPMAGSGTVAVTATRLGHTTWASDSAPAHPYIARVDLLERDLAEVLEGSPHPLVDLMFLHPPLPASLDLQAAGFPADEGGYGAWLGAILEHTLHALRAGGHLVLVLPLGISPSLLHRAQAQLFLSLQENFGPQQPLTLKASHLAVARSGREGWHLFVAQSPALQRGD